MLGVMNKSIKTFGKAMSQVSEEFEHFGNDNSIGAQSHAQVSALDWMTVCMLLLHIRHC